MTLFTNSVYAQTVLIGISLGMLAGIVIALKRIFLMEKRITRVLNNIKHLEELDAKQEGRLKKTKKKTNKKTKKRKKK